jgi:hypothetical protein
MSATDFQHPLAAEIDLGRRTVIKVDDVPVGVVGRLQRQGRRRIFFVAPADEYQIITTEVTGRDGS